MIELKHQKKKNIEIPDQQIDLNEFIGIKGLKAKGNRLTTNPIKEINNISPPDPEEPTAEIVTDELIVPESAVEIDYARLEQLKNIRQNLDNMDTQMTLDF
jgi:topoisomerase-4 subunit A